MDDLIEARPDEQLDVDALTEWLATQDHLPKASPDVLQYAGGKANLTYLLVFPDGSELVLRRPPLGPVAATSHDMTREYRVLSRLWRAFVKAPRALAYCDDPGVIGAPFFLMEKLDGLVVRREVPEVFGGGRDSQANRRLSEVVVDTMAELHAVDPADCGLEDLGHPEGYLGRQVAGWTRRWEHAKHEENELADQVAGWLAEKIPASGPPTLVHNDWRLDNLAISPDDPGVCTAVFDWDMATRGDPLADLGTLMGSWFDPGEAPEGLGMMPTKASGWLDRRSAVKRYGEKMGRDLSTIDWYLVFGSWKLGVILQQIFIRWLRGQTQDSRFEHLHKDARHLFKLAAYRVP